MEKYYRADDLIKTFENLRNIQSSYGLHDKAIDTGYFIQMLLEQPAIELEEHKQGEWIVCGDGEYVPFKCTACGNNTSWYHKQTAKYCPNCGAKMIKED